MSGKQDVQILELHPVGNYAVRLVFDDTHSTGIFSWDFCSSSARTVSNIGATIWPSLKREIFLALQRRANARSACGRS